MANKTATQARGTTMAGPSERCIGIVPALRGGRQVGYPCPAYGSDFQNHLCLHHQYQHYGPQYPTLDSDRQTPEKRTYHSRASQSAGQRNPSQAGASKRQRPVNNPSRGARGVEPSQPNPPQQQLASLNIQLPTPPEEPHRGRRAPLEPSRPVPLHPPTPTEASNAIKDPKEGLPTGNAPTPPSAKREASGNYLPGLTNQHRTPVRLALWVIAKFHYEAEVNTIRGYNPEAGSRIVRERCGLIQLLRAACEDGEKAERFRQNLWRWMESNGREVNDELVESLGLIMD